MGRKRHTVPNKAKMRNLVQYKDKTDEEFDQIFEDKYGGTENTLTLSADEKEEMIKRKIEALGKDYDLSDMKVNDLAQLRNYASVTIQLEDVETEIAEIIDEGITQSNIATFEKLNSVASKLRGDVSSIFQDLGINRKHRKSQNEQSVIDAITDIKRRAKKFIEGKMVYVFCPECRMLLATAWVHYKEPKASLLTCECQHCSHKVTVDLGSLYETNHKNLEDVLIP